MEKGRFAAGIAVGIVLGLLIFRGLGIGPMAGFGHLLLWPLFAIFGLAIALLGLAIGLFFAAFPLLLVVALVVLIVKVVNKDKERPASAPPDEVAVNGP